MKAQWSMVLGALALAAGPLAAQAPFQTTFNLQNTMPNAPVIDGGYSSPYIGAFVTNNTVGASFDVWCVDLNHEAFLGDKYNVWVSALDQSNLSHTRGGSGDAQLYEWAAVLASDMKLDWTGAVNSRAEDAAIQDAMWALLGEGSNTSTRLHDFVHDYGADLGLSYNFWTAGPSSNVWQNFALITCDPGTDRSVTSCGEQEFLVELPSTTQSVTPEPATMTMLATGLVGMMGAGGLRRRRKSA